MKELLKIHRNCEWYNWKPSKPSESQACLNRAMGDLRYTLVDPTGEACECFESVKK